MNGRLWLGVLGLVAACAALPAAAQFGDKPSKLQLVKVQDDLYVIHNDYVPGNTTALITNQGVILVDDKFEVDHDNIMAMLKTVTNQPVKYVINTHYHGDHSGGNARLQAAGTLAVASAQARARMVEGKMSGLPDITIAPRGTLYLGGKVVEMYWLGRSHTDGDIVVLFPQNRVIATGDMYTHGEGTPELIDYAGGGSAKEWTATVENALKLDFDTVIPGHGDVTNKADLVKFRDSTKRLTELVTQMVRQNKSKADIEATMRKEFGWQDLHVQRALDGLIKEMR
ncbi:MAG TPA: MBL fold metallo-hydrolase [Gammaproteobacteria bacterium]|jgi:glyoxylase-like metal-dependent hydrolase (beta-lactamase superfamily II)|nr:MBL fold metallo-hydrolase [Gammaproteobacteria bacterium]